MSERQPSMSDAAFDAMLNASIEEAKAVREKERLSRPRLPAQSTPHQAEQEGVPQQTENVLEPLPEIALVVEQPIKMPDLTPSEREDADRLLAAVVNALTTDVAKAAELTRNHRALAHSLMSDRRLKPTEIVEKLKWSIRESERLVTNQNRGERSEYQMRKNAPEYAQAQAYRAITTEPDERKRRLAMLRLVADIAAEEMRLDRTDSRIQAVTEQLLPLVEKWLQLTEVVAENVVLNLHAKVRQLAAKPGR